MKTKISSVAFFGLARRFASSHRLIGGCTGWRRQIMVLPSSCSSNSPKINRPQTFLFRLTAPRPFCRWSATARRGRQDGNAAGFGNGRFAGRRGERGQQGYCAIAQQRKYQCHPHHRQRHLVSPGGGVNRSSSPATGNFSVPRWTRSISPTRIRWTLSMPGPTKKRTEESATLRME